MVVIRSGWHGAAVPVVFVAWLAGSLGACEGGNGEGGVSSPCEALAERWRGCGLLSEGEVDCRLFESPSYGECATACVEAASCEEMREQACDDRDNEYAFCVDRCQADLFRFFACGDGTEVARERRCDGAADCASGADEADCDEPEPVFECGDGERVLADDVCDGEADCVSGRDEVGCPARAMTICPGGF